MLKTMVILDSILDFLKSAASYGPFWVSLAVALIAFFQWKTARDKVRFDLYEKRFRIYEAVLAFISEVVADSVGQNQVIAFDVARNEAFFLFAADREIMAYLDQIRSKAQDHNIWKSQAKSITGSPSPERSECVKQMLAITDWFFKQPDEARKIFAPYLSFKR